jgi:hypothetical protein
MTNVASASRPEEPDVTSYAVTGWGRTARLCAIRLAEAAPAFVPLMVWLSLRR